MAEISTSDAPSRRECFVIGKSLILDFDQYDLNNVLADIEEIRKYNPQRYEFEQLTAVVHEDAKLSVCVGYKDITENEFWVRGHMPGIPVMPGVLMCEAAAQLCSYFATRYDLIGTDLMLGFGGLDKVKFRDPVRVGDRLVLVAKLLKVRRGALIACGFQCFVKQQIVCEGKLKGIALPIELLKQAAG